MAQPKSPPLSVRLGAERLARIDAYAAEQGITRHAAVLALLDRGLADTATSPIPPKDIAEAALQSLKANVYLPPSGKMGAPEAAPVKWVLPKAAYGSRQKGSKK